MLGLGLGATPLIGALDVADAVAQDGATRDALTRRLRDGHMETGTVRPRGSRIAWGRCLAMVDGRFGEVIHALTDFAHYHRLLAPLVNESRVLSRSHGRAQVYVQGSLAARDAVWAQLSVRITGQQDGTHWIDANMVRGNLEALFARWQLVSTTGRTRTIVSFRLLAAPRVALPQSWIEDQNARAAEGAMYALRIRCRELRGRPPTRGTHG